IIFNNFRVSLIIGVFTLIMIVFSLLIRRKISKEKALKDEFDEGFTTEKVEEYWFRYEIGGMPKPVRWQGWACYVIIFLSPFVVLIFDNDLDTAFVIILAIISAFIVISMLKSNYKERSCPFFSACANYVYSFVYPANSIYECELEEFNVFVEVSLGNTSKYS
ncbi:MAG: hypothetical protein K8E24_007995, partial [Methanobacterium paludis]|nr:hypothetical protein [Methanobacterium paludis]